MAHKKYTTFCWEGKKGSVFFFYKKKKKIFKKSKPKMTGMHVGT